MAAMSRPMTMPARDPKVMMPGVLMSTKYARVPPWPDWRVEHVLMTPPTVPRVA